MFLRKVFFIAILTWFACTVLGYGVYKALPIILGPKIEILTPHDGDQTDAQTIEVRGEVTRTKGLYVNGIATAFNEEGVFYTKLAVYPGSNIIFIKAEDKFGRSVSKTINIGAK